MFCPHYIRIQLAAAVTEVHKEKQLSVHKNIETALISHE